MVERNIDDYERLYASAYDFEVEQVECRRQAVLRSVRAVMPETVVEIGCGMEPLLPHCLAAGGMRVERWIVVEPAKKFAANARRVASDYASMEVIEGFLEDVVDELVAARIQVDMVICSGLLHEVPDQHRLLQAIARLMTTESVLHINVPNARSLHRRLAKALGLIEDLEQMSERNLLLQQQRVYSRDSLHADLVQAGMRVQNEGGILLKPFTHGQMLAVMNSIGKFILPGLAVLGQELPEIASEIFADAKLDLR